MYVYKYILTAISIFAIFFFNFRDDNIDYIIQKDKIYNFFTKSRRNGLI